VLEGDLTASRKQARITCVADCYCLEDSTNGTLLNGKQIHSRALLNHDDVLNLGRRKYVFSMIEVAHEEDDTVHLGNSNPVIVSLVHSAQRMVCDLLNRLGSTSQSSCPSAYASSLAATVPEGNHHRFAKGKLSSGALRQYQKRKQIPFNLESYVHSLK